MDTTLRSLSFDEIYQEPQSVRMNASYQSPRRSRCLSGCFQAVRPAWRESATSRPKRCSLRHCLPASLYMEMDLCRLGHGGTKSTMSRGVSSCNHDIRTFLRAGSAQIASSTVGRFCPESPKPCIPGMEESLILSGDSSMNRILPRNLIRAKQASKVSNVGARDHLFQDWFGPTEGQQIRIKVL